MKTRIDSIHFEANEQLLDFINQKVDELDNIHSRIENCNVILRIDKNNKKKDKVVEISLNIPGSHLFSCDQSEDFEMAVGLAVNEMKIQLLKHKQKNKDWEPIRKVLSS